MSNFYKNAFTLIELLVVIAVIGILSGLIVVSMNGVTNKASVARSQIFSNSLKNSIMLDLVSEWRLDEGSGTSVTDSWNGGNSGVLNGATHLPTWKTGSECVSGSCIQLDGIDDFINFNDTNDTMDLDDGNKGTLEIWVKVASWPTTGYPSIISKGTGGSGWSGGSYHISFWTGAIRFVIYSTTPLYDSTSTASLPSINTWHNLVLTWTGKNGGVLKGYVDGNAVNPTGTSQTQLANFRSGEALRIGRSSPDFFAGTVDEVRLYKNGISALQIKNNYYLGLNKLFFNGSIGKEEYLSRISEYAIK